MSVVNTTTRADRKGRLVRVALVVAYLRGGWRSGQQIMSYVELESERAGRRTRYNNVQGATRNAKWRALIGGLCWQYMDVNEQMTDAGSAFRLWSITEEMVPRPHPAWQHGDARVVMMQGDPTTPTVRVYERPDLEAAKQRSEAEIERLRGGGVVSIGARRVCSGDTDRPSPSFHDGRRLGPEAETEAGEQGRLWE